MLTCAVSIATHNRLDELQRTCAVLAALDPPPDELLIAADGCTDDTADWVRAHRPEARLFENTPGKGSIAARDEMIRAARSDLLLSLDDDSYPVEPDFIARLRDLFGKMPLLAVASFPQRTDEYPETLTATDFGPAHFPGSYVNAASAFRRAAYLELDGWDLDFRYAYDEPDYALQCAAAGWQVYHTTGATIRHHYSPKNRDEMRIHQRHAVNEQWSAWKRCPFPWVLGVAAFRAVRQLGYAASRGPRWVLHEPAWWWKALGGLGRCLRSRRPASWRAYRAWMQLARTPLRTEAEWCERFGGGA